MTRHALFTLDVGDVAVSFPDEIPEAEVDHIEAYFALLLKGIRRRAKARTETLANASAGSVTAGGDEVLGAVVALGS